VILRSLRLALEKNSGTLNDYDFNHLFEFNSPQFSADVVIPAKAGIQWFVCGHRLSPV
jgi:hypothetical protein